MWLHTRLALADDFKSITLILADYYLMFEKWKKKMTRWYKRVFMNRTSRWNTNNNNIIVILVIKFGPFECCGAKSSKKLYFGWKILTNGVNFRGRKSGQGGSSRQYTTRPEASALDYMIRPQSKVDPEEIRARAKQNVPDPRRQKVSCFSTIHFLISTFHITIASVHKHFPWK